MPTAKNRFHNLVLHLEKHTIEKKTFHVLLLDLYLNFLWQALENPDNPPSKKKKKNPD